MNKDFMTNDCIFRKKFLVALHIPISTIIKDENNNIDLEIKEEIKRRFFVYAISYSDAKMKALQEIRKDNKGLYWTRALNKNPFKYIKIYGVKDEEYRNNFRW